MACSLSPWSWAQSTYPVKPIRILVATVAGSGPDIAVRKMAPLLSELARQPVVVENRPGANGMIAVNEVLKAPRDGYTLLNANIGNALNDLLRPQTGGRMFEDLLPITDLTAGPLVLLVHRSVPVQTAAEFLAYAKSHPGQLNFGSGGPGSLIQLTGERLKWVNGLDIKEVPYKSFGADIVDLVAGHIQVGFSVWSLIEPHVRAGKIRALAIASHQRSIPAADIPTFAEAGLGDISATGWNGMFAPAGTPADILQWLGKSMQIAVQRPEFKDFFVKDGSEIGGKSLEQFGAFIRSEQDRYRQVIQRANIKVSDS
jgi:tripartite-type tricarboxylate transporter receptor subunit TctC